jgi:hypothetical protein
LKIRRPRHVIIRGMGRIAACALIIGLSLAAVASAAARSGVSGRVSLDGVYGASQGGVPATIRIQRARSGRLVRTVHTDTGHFRVRLRPGRYRLRAAADGGNGAGSARARVRRHHFTSVVIHLHSPAP